MRKFRVNTDWPFVHKVRKSNTGTLQGFEVEMLGGQLHFTYIALICCFVSPMMRFAAGTVNRAFGIKEETLLNLVGRESGLTDVFFCHGMVGVVVTIYLN
jgi:hypothetical protein